MDTMPSSMPLQDKTVFYSQQNVEESLEATSPHQDQSSRATQESEALSQANWQHEGQAIHQEVSVEVSIACKCSCKKDRLRVL